MSTPVSNSINPRFSEEEQKRLREIFAPTAQKYRSRSRLAFVVLGIGFVIIFSGLLLNSYTGWIFGAFSICWLVIFFVAIIQSSLECPACHGNLVSSELGSYCPECGAANLKPGGWFRVPHCYSCGKSLRRGKTRQYKIHACTHCGLMLSDRGL
ncbi:MAG TPA: hypothetical protein VK742_07765 [Candidatus Sulfotelmatobacter sp.]|jgi:predicted RNA-binding Zn-ribbon protein involved in translation (DUF1610 family)|nr:hypothetical protein [Candidatus Sulfotelmatobacter sp.]